MHNIAADTNILLELHNTSMIHNVFTFSQRAENQRVLDIFQSTFCTLRSEKMQQFGNGLKFCDLPCLLMNCDWIVGEGEGFDSAGGATSTREAVVQL